MIAQFSLGNFLLGLWMLTISPVLTAGLSDAFTGSWFDPEFNGEGFIVEVLADQRVVVYWFTYDPSGNQVWLTGIGRAAGNFIHVEEMLVTRNGFFGPEHNPDNVERKVWGSVELQLDCSAGTAIYDAIDPSWGRGDHSMTRLTQVAGLNCVHDDYTVVAGRDLTGLWQSDGFGYAAKIDANGFSIMQHTASSCLEVASGPVAELETAGDDLHLNRFGDRLLFSGLDSVSPVRFDKVESLPVACLGGDSGFGTDPLYNFNVFSDTFSELYSAFDIRNLDWNATIDQYQGSINPNTTSRSLFNTFSNMLRPLQDGHVSIVAPPDVFHVNRVGQTELRDRAFLPAVDNILRNSYLNGIRLVAANGVLRYGMHGNGIAYLEVTRLNNILDNASTNQAREFLRGELDDVFAWFKDRAAVGLVIDVRRNDGGNSAFGLEIAGRLNRGPSRIVFSERRPTANGETEAIATALIATEGEGFDGPIALLTSALTASAAEIFTLTVRAIPQVTSVGSPSNGVLSRTERVLSNGWIVSITAGHVEAPNGDRYEAVGIPVDIQTPVFTSGDIEANLDSAVDMALAVLE